MHTSDSMNRRTDKLVDLQLAAKELELQKELIKVLAIESEKKRSLFRQLKLAIPSCYPGS